MAFANHRCLYIVLSWILSSLNMSIVIKHWDYHHWGYHRHWDWAYCLQAPVWFLAWVLLQLAVWVYLRTVLSCICLTILKTHFKALLTRLIAFCVYWPMFDNKIDCRPVSGHFNGISLSLFEIHSRLVLFLLSGHLNRDTHLNLKLRMSKNSSFITQLSSFEFALVYSARPQRSFGYEHRHSGRGVGLFLKCLVEIAISAGA